MNIEKGEKFKNDFFVLLPKKVSRFYPLFALTLLLLSSSLYYVWQKAKIEHDVLYASIEKREESLRSQVESLTANKVENEAKLNSQEKVINNNSTQIADIEQQLKTKSDKLVTEEQTLKTVQNQLANQTAQLSKNATELEALRSRPPLFNFSNKSSLTEVQIKEDDVREVVTNAYNYIQDLYGKPYLLNSITITFVDEFSIPGSAGEIQITNSNEGVNIDIHLKDFDKNNFQDVNTIIHEVIHGFHGVAVFESSALEEGMTIAATDAVMAKMIKDKKIPNFSHLYVSITDLQYNQYNKTLSISTNNDTFYSSKDVGKAYQLIGKAWYNLYLTNENFFNLLNQAYYPTYQKGIKGTDNVVLDAIKTIIPNVNGVSINSYLSSNIAFNPS